METYGVVRYFSISYLLMTMLVLDLIFSQQQEMDAFTYYYYEATRLYEAHQYDQALTLFLRAREENLSYMERTPQIQFKIAYCYYRLQHYQEAVSILTQKIKGKKFLPDYLAYFTLRSRLALGDTTAALHQLQAFRKEFPSSALMEIADSLSADLYFQRSQWDSARIFYRNYLKYPGVDKGEIYGKLVRIASIRRDNGEVKKYAFRLIAAYPFHPRSKAAYRAIARLYKGRLMPESQLRKVVRYLAKTGQFREVDRVLDRYQKLGGETELIRWLKIRKLYDQKRYRETFRACREQREHFHKTKYWREIDLHLARCYLKLGYVDKAIKAYETFQRRYPKDRLADEVLWVLAWLSEGQGKIDRAKRYYHQLIRQYPHSDFLYEARFRLGLSEYRQHHFQTARAIWSAFLDDGPGEAVQTRVTYWIAKSYAQEKNFSNYLSLLTELAKKPFDSYYNLKAFLLIRKGTQIHQFVDSLLWEMHEQQLNLLPRYVQHFKKALQVQELLGSGYARRELFNVSAKSKHKNAEWEMDYALGEINERLENYGRAYRRFRRVYNRYFSDRDWQEWVFLFNRLYPFYFNDEILQNARQWNITPASIWAIIKKESAFEPHIISYANAYGLMQIIPPTAQRLAKSLGIELDDVRQLYNPSFNIFLGSYYLAELIKRYEGNLYYALAAYNAGEQRVDRWRKEINTEDDDFFMENIEFEQTRVYVRTVMKFYWTYHLMIHPQKVPEYVIPFPEKVAREPWFDGVELR